MSTDTYSSTENQDLPTNQDGVTTEETIEAIKNDDQEILDQPIDNTPDNPEATPDHPITQNTPHEEITADISDNSDDPHSTKDQELNKQEPPSNLSPVVNTGVSSINFSTFLESVSTFEQVRQVFQLIVKRVDKSLSQNNAQLDMKMARILEENTQLHLDLTNLTEKQSLEITSLIDLTEKQSLEIKSLNERLAKLEESAKFKFDALIQDALKKDDAVWDEDSAECQKYIEQAKFWHSKTEALYTSVLTAISDCGDRIDKCGDLMQEINKESSTLHNSLLDRYKSLELSKRMLERLREPIELLKKSTLPSEQLLRLQLQDLVDLLRSQNDEAEAQKILAKKVKETGDTRYKSIREWRDLAEKSQKQWLNFIEKKLLFALDGINDGKPYAEHLVGELINGYKIPSCQQKLSDWLQTYVDLENILIEALKNLDITQLLVVRSQPVDYDRHEPIGTEPDPNLPHESIKEVTRNGYEYKLPDQEQPSILRSAQVIVVKNK
jgi:hypothetical protein